MPWLETSPMTERRRFVDDAHRGLFSMTHLCARYGISRKTGYKWLDRYDAQGRDGLQDRSHAPQACPHEILEEVARAICEGRRAHPSWGPRKLLRWLGRHQPGLALPAISTAGDLLAREGLVKRRGRRPRHRHPGVVAAVTQQPNDLWTSDFKGHFRTGDGRYCYPLTVADLHSRLLLGCDALLSTRGREARPCFEALFRAHGLPAAIRTDNGVPFASTGLHGISAFGRPVPKKTARTSGCTAPSSARRRGRPRPIVIGNSWRLIASVRSTTSSARMKPSAIARPPPSIGPLRGRSQTACRRSSIPATFRSASSLTPAPSVFGIGYSSSPMRSVGSGTSVTKQSGDMGDKL